MSCLIEVDYDCGDSPEIFRSRDVEARKVHRCCECGREISPGERYKYETGLWAGVFRAFKTCSDCLSVRSLFCDQPPFTTLYSCLWDEIYESYGGEHIANNLGQLTTAARWKVCEMFEKYWSENDREDEL